MKTRRGLDQFVMSLFCTGIGALALWGWWTLVALTSKTKPAITVDPLTVIGLVLASWAAGLLVWGIISCGHQMLCAKTVSR